MKKKVWLSVVTPFNEDKTLNIFGIKKYIEFLDQYNFEGFLIGGSVGEGLLLSYHELALYFDIIRSISNKKIIIGAIEFNYPNLEQRLNLDADYFLVTPPIYFKPHPLAIIEYIKRVASSGKKIILYNNPSRVGVAFNEDIYLQLYEIQNIVGVKECDDKLILQGKSKFPRWEWLTGNDPMFDDVDYIDGVISTLGNITSSSIAKLDKEKWQKLCAYAYSLPNPIAIKLVFQELGLFQAHFRAAFDPLPEFKYFEKFILNQKLIY